MSLTYDIPFTFIFQDIRSDLHIVFPSVHNLPLYYSQNSIYQAVKTMKKDIKSRQKGPKSRNIIVRKIKKS